MEQPPASIVAGRACGDCTACCVDLAIPVADLAKPAGEPCRHCTGQGCAIYATRPQFCRDYECVWRSMPALDESWRPDRSGVLIVWSSVPPGDPATHAVDVVVTGPPGTVESARFAGLLSGFVAQGVATFLSLPRGVGFASTVAQVNALLADAVRRRDREGARSLILSARDAMMARPPRPLDPVPSPEGQG